MTVHKSQGSEFAHTVVVLPREGGAVLARELVYTGITRAKEHFTLCTPSAAVLDTAIGQRTQRASGLRALWVGGIGALERLTERFYQRVADDAILAPVFQHMGSGHPAHVAAFLAEVLGGPAEYSARHGGHAHMIRQHLN
eukprot:gene41697-51673_t